MVKRRQKSCEMNFLEYFKGFLNSFFEEKAVNTSLKIFHVIKGINVKSNKNKRKGRAETFDFLSSKFPDIIHLRNMLSQPFK